MGQARGLLAALAMALTSLAAGCQTDREGIRVDFTQLQRAYRAYYAPEPSRRQVEALLMALPARTHNDLGVLYEREGRLADAQRQYERAIAKDYRFTRAYINLGNVLRQQGRYQEALHRYRQALTLEPGNFEAANNFGDLCACLGTDLEEAVAILGRCLPGAGSYAAYGWDTVGWLQHLQGSNQEAAHSLERALLLAPAQEQSLQALIYHHLALIYLALGRVQEAEAAAAQAQALGWTQGPPTTAAPAARPCG